MNNVSVFMVWAVIMSIAVSANGAGGACLAIAATLTAVSLVIV